MGDASERPGFESGSGFLLARLGSLAARGWNVFLAERELTQVQYATLSVLAEHGTVGQLRLAGLVAVDARNLVAVLDQLVRRRLVVRETDALDRRRRNVRLTAGGVALVQELAGDAARSRDEFFGVLTLPQRKQLNALLHELYEAHAHQPGDAADQPSVTILATR